MAKGHDLLPILEKLQRPRGYQGCRIRPDLNREKIWFAEMYTPDQLRNRKSWKLLLAENTNKPREFSSPEEAQKALIEARRELFTDNRPFYIQLHSEIPQQILWKRFISQKEQLAPGSLEEMIEDASQRLTAAMRELRQCKNQKRLNKLYEIIIGQSNRLHYLGKYINEESKRLQ